MPRDYARNGSSRHKPLPGWLWGLGGLAVGLFVAFLVWLDKQPEPPTPSLAEMKRSLEQKARRAAEDVTRKAREKTAAAKRAAEQEPELDFYVVLPQLEVTVSDAELEEERKRPAPRQKVRYMLQAGSFRDYAKADRLKATVALLGLTARIQKVTIEGRGTWHQVRVGPFDSLRKLDQARARLQKQGIQPIVLKLK